MTSELDINALEARITRLEKAMHKVGRAVHVLTRLEAFRRDKEIAAAMSDMPDDMPGQEPAGSNS
ncbi:MAG: hypothetical protein JNM75_03015 [Rhodospirillales bacterium]|nr:hypothetical protein [Rhodospirillales bacterium]